MPYKRKDKCKKTMAGTSHGKQQTNQTGFLDQERSHKMGGGTTKKGHLIDTHNIFG